MSSGTFVKVERYFNHYHFHSLEHLRREREESLKRREEIWAGIKGLVYATPRDITPHDCDTCEYLEQRLIELREELEGVEFELGMMADIEEGWETREED